MFHVKADGTKVQLGICQPGTFGPATSPDCSEFFDYFSLFFTVRPGNCSYV